MSVDTLKRFVEKFTMTPRVWDDTSMATARAESVEFVTRNVEPFKLVLNFIHVVRLPDDTSTTMRSMRAVSLPTPVTDEEYPALLKKVYESIELLESSGMGDNPSISDLEDYIYPQIILGMLRAILGQEQNKDLYSIDMAKLFTRLHLAANSRLIFIGTRHTSHERGLEFMGITPELQLPIVADESAE